MSVLALAACGDGGRPQSSATGESATTTAASTSGAPGSTGAATTGDGSSEGSGAATTSATSSTSATGEATGETGAETTGAPPPGRAYDLDDDGANDTDLAIAPCSQDAQWTCLVVQSEIVAGGEVVLAGAPDACTGQLAGARLRLVGDHGGDGLSEVMAGFCAGDRPSVAVVDVALSQVVGSAIAPPPHTNAWVEAAADPQGRLHPLLAPSYGDGGDPNATWGYLCAYRPELPGDMSCGTGFSKVALWSGAGVFREVGGTLQDVDGDGWQDINVIYHRAQLTVSIATLATLQLLEYDVAAATEPGAPQWFHSGRNYGTHAAVVGGDGRPRLVIVGGTPVGAFTDDLCNVSRFVAVLAGEPGQPATRTLAWSQYFGFSSTIFKTYDPQYAGDPMQDVARLADAVDGCIHRFADSRTRIDGQAAIVVNYFAMQAPVDLCLDEQFQLYIPPTWTQEKADAWYGCFAKNRKAPGVWGMQAVREVDGAGITGSQGTYVWGWSTTLRTGGEPLYLVESLPGTTLWDLSDRAPSPLQVLALVDGLWAPRGVFPVAGRPKIALVAAEGARGVGSYTSFAELTAEDRDGDGLDEVALAGGAWIGWDAQAQAFAVKR